MESQLISMTERVVFASADASVAVLNAAIEAFYEADFCSNSHRNAHYLRVFAVRTERAVNMIAHRLESDPAEWGADQNFPSTVQG